MGGLLRAHEGKERVLSSLRDPSQLDHEPSKTAALNQDRLQNNQNKRLAHKHNVIRFFSLTIARRA